MIRNYLKIAWRNLSKNKVFSFINIFGLATGFTCCMLITFYLYHEVSYDKYHQNASRLFQLGTVFVREGSEDFTPNTPAPMATAMQQEYPEIEKSTRLLRAFLDDKTLLQVEDAKGQPRSFYETKGFLADSNFFQVLTYHFIEGRADNALVEPNTIVLSEEIAKKLFPDGPALNKVVHVSSSTNGDYDFRVTGVFRPIPKPSHIDGHFFMSMNGGNMQRMARITDNMANNNMFYTYFLLRKGADAKKLEAKFPAFIEKYAGRDLKQAGFSKKQFLTAVPDIHLYSKIKNNVTPAGSLTYLYVLASIALFTLLIACINFMNLSTARSSRRSAEVGVRKVLGAERSSLIRQFLGESILLSILAFAIALVIVWLLLPIFGQVAGMELRFPGGDLAIMLTAFLVLALVTGILAGSYPAFYLSSFIPVKVLKGKFKNSLAAVSLRKGLVVFQFVISVVLIIAFVVISDQMKYMRSKDLGFDREQQLVIPMRSNSAKAIYTSLKSELSNNPRIKMVGGTYYYPGIMNPSDIMLFRDGKTVEDGKRVYQNYVDANFLQTLGIKPVAGRIFSPEFPGDTSNRMVINETAAKEVGFSSPQEAIGHFLQLNWQGQLIRWEIIGVVKDFHFKDLHNPIEPYGFQLNNDTRFNYLVARMQGGDISGTLNMVRKAWNRLNPNEPFEYSFMDEDFARNYAAEERLSSIVAYFTILAILISCLGLFGLASFSAEQRTKEIGIRKVLGASVTNIVGLISRDFLKLVVAAVIVATPIAWYVMNRWLQDFAYRVNLGWWIFVLAAALALLIAFLTISMQAVKAAVTNPVMNLRSE